MFACTTRLLDRSFRRFFQATAVEYRLEHPATSKEDLKLHQAAAESARLRALTKSVHEYVKEFEQDLFRDYKIRVRRSLFFVPGSDARKVEKTTRFGLDSVCLDLEDGVALTAKETARKNIVEALNTLDFGSTETFVRINKVGSGLETEDLHFVLSKIPPAKLTGIIIPKVEVPSQVEQVCNLVKEFEEKKGKPLLLLLGVETAMGIVNLKEIARSDPRVDSLVFGAEDFTADIGAVRSSAAREVLYPRQKVVTTCAGYGLHPIDMVTVDIANSRQLIAIAKDSYNMGFQGKQAIHPNQIEVIHKMFRPQDDDVDRAFKLCESYLQNTTTGFGAFNFHGTMVDRPVFLRNLKLILRAYAVYEKEAALQEAPLVS